MTAIIQELYNVDVCYDCVALNANGPDENTSAHATEAAKTWGNLGQLVISTDNSEPHFGHYCEVCSTYLAGDRFTATVTVFAHA